MVTAMSAVGRTVTGHVPQTQGPARPGAPHPRDQGAGPRPPLGLPPLTLVPDQGLQLLPDALVPAGDVHVQGVVAAGPGVRSLPPLLEGRQQAHARVRAHVVHCGGSVVS